MAVGLGRLAEIQGGWAIPNLGERAAARPTFERAEAMLAALVQRRPDEWAWRRDLGRVQQRLADFYGGVDNDSRKQLAKAREAEGQLQRALDAAVTAKASARDQAELHTLLSSARLAQAFAMDWIDESPAAITLATAEEARLLALPETIQREMDFGYRAGRAAGQLGDSLFFLDRFEESLAAYRRDLQGLARHRGTLAGIDRQALFDYLAMRTRAGYSARSNARLLSALRAYFASCVRRGERSDDPTALLLPPRLPRVAVERTKQRPSMASPMRKSLSGTGASKPLPLKGPTLSTLMPVRCMRLEG